MSELGLATQVAPQQQHGAEGGVATFAPGKQTRADTGAPPAAEVEERESGDMEDDRADDWEMDDGLASAMGLGGVSTSQAASDLGDTRAATDGGDRPQGLKFRVPTGAEIKSMLAKKEVPEDKLKASIQTALERMKAEKLLKTKESIAKIMKKLFPKPGVFNERALAKIVKVSDRNKVYQSVSDAQTKVNNKDKAKLSSAMDDAVTHVDKAIANAAGLTAVFGTKSADALAIYQKAKASITTLKAKMDTNVHTDYNGDDSQIGLGGWASPSSQVVHLETAVAKVKDLKDTIITVIHECCHLADTSVDDLGYYGSDGFEAMEEDEKIANAAHFEELPRRSLGRSSYAKKTFTPGVTSSGGAVTFEDEVRREASEYLRQSWDKSVDVHIFLRNIRKEQEAGNKLAFSNNEARILEISKLEKLTIHEQAKPSSINMNDIVLAEGVARATVIIQGKAESQPVPSAPVAPKDKSDYVQDVIKGAIAAYGHLTGSAASDKTLMDWLVAEYGKPL